MSKEPIGKVTRYRCLVTGCEWTHDVEPLDPRIGPDCLASVFGTGVFEATARTRQMADTEYAIREHLKTHTVEEWVATLSKLRSLVEGLTESFRALQVRAEPAEDDAPDLSELLGMKPLSGEEFARKISTGVLPVCDHEEAKP